MPKLSAMEVRRMEIPYRLSDGAGLFYESTDTPIKRWLHRFKLGGKNMYVIGRYPELSLETARKENKKKDDRAKSFERVALEWIKQKRGGSSQPHTEAAIRTLENTVFSQIGP